MSHRPAPLPLRPAARPRRRFVAGLLVGLLSLSPALPLTAQADVYVVVPATSTVKSMTQKEVVDLYMGRTRAFPGGEFALPFDLPREHAGRAAFYLALTGMGPAQVNSYWSRLMFSGQTMPPQSVADEAAMIDIVKRTPGAVGWVRKEPADKQLRVLLVLKEST